MEKISLAKFLARYLNLRGEDLKKVTHDDVKILFPFLKRSSFDDYTKNNNGNILLVDDGKSLIPYYIPEIIEDYEINLFEREEDKKEEVVTKYNYCDLTNYELRLLLRHRFNGISVNRKAKMELEKRNALNRKKYTRKLKYKERIEE